jgi:hypothetical protein
MSENKLNGPPSSKGLIERPKRTISRDMFWPYRVYVDGICVAEFPSDYESEMMYQNLVSSQKVAALSGKESM